MRSQIGECSHIPKVAGSNPAPATKEKEASQIALAFSFSSEKSYNTATASKVIDPNLQVTRPLPTYLHFVAGIIPPIRCLSDSTCGGNFYIIYCAAITHC
jgi:hypothetical protein